MKLTFLGTAAAEGLPAVWCNCSVCRKAKEMGGIEFRTRSQILIDSKLLVDFPMDTYMHMLTHKFDLSAIDSVLITHAHMDHCYPQEFVLHGEPFAHGMTEPKITVYGNATVAESFESATRAELKPEIAPSVPMKKVEPFDCFTTESGYKITALPAVHTAGEQCLFYAVEHCGKTALLFNDSGILPNETYDKMAKLGLKFDLVSFDCTYGHAKHGKGRHMGALDADGERDKMKECNLVHNGTKYVLTHFSHNCNLTHSELCKKEKDYGFTVAYDGMTVEI